MANFTTADENHNRRQQARSGSSALPAAANPCAWLTAPYDLVNIADSILEMGDVEIVSGGLVKQCRVEQRCLLTILFLGLMIIEGVLDAGVAY
jgi:hypothetical protein